MKNLLKINRKGAMCDFVAGASWAKVVEERGMKGKLPGVTVDEGLFFDKDTVDKTELLILFLGKVSEWESHQLVNSDCHPAFDCVPASKVEPFSRRKRMTTMKKVGCKFESPGAMEEMCNL
ncbi:hypothetical protein EUX98_g8599 [Antrodiella citrinella]|uniref:Uncharacterized protein n=1 Tax=Antrodiella citrinella TaxID=2447956 RepID=A0A4S4MBH2_9APHY|nr:hypothetical protein EUX98_g8599 [Antrodiella citrinella]